MKWNWLFDGGVQYLVANTRWRWRKTRNRKHVENPAHWQWRMSKPWVEQKYNTQYTLAYFN